MIQRPLSHDEEGLDSVNLTATEAYVLGAVEYHEVRQAALLFNRTAFLAAAIYVAPPEMVPRLLRRKLRVRALSFALTSSLSA